MLQFWVNLENITHRNHSNDKYGLICFQLVSSIDIQVKIYVKWQNGVKESWQNKLLAYDNVLIEIQNIRH